MAHGCSSLQLPASAPTCTAAQQQHDLLLAALPSIWLSLSKSWLHAYGAHQVGRLWPLQSAVAQKPPMSAPHFWHVCAQPRRSQAVLHAPSPQPLIIEAPRAAPAAAHRAPGLLCRLCWASALFGPPLSIRPAVARCLATGVLAGQEPAAAVHCSQAHI